MTAIAAEGALPHVSLRERFVELVWGQRTRNRLLMTYGVILVVTAALWHFRDAVDPYLGRLHWVPGMAWVDANPLLALLAVVFVPIAIMWSILAWIGMPALVPSSWNKLAYYAVCAVAPGAFAPMCVWRASCPLVSRNVVYDNPPPQTQQYDPSASGDYQEYGPESSDSLMGLRFDR